MRMKRLLGTILLMMLATALAAAAAARLTGVQVASAGLNTSIITLRANGGFTHTEYRPTETLLLVDMNGVSAGQLDAKTHVAHSPSVVSYRVLGYKSASGSEVARLELTLATGAGVSVSEAKDELRVKVTGSGAGVEASPVTAPTPVAAHVPAAPASKHAPGKTAVVREIAAARAPDGMQVSILASAPLTPKAMKLTGPDRVVVDLENATPAGKGQQLTVNTGEVKAVRMARFQMNPPVTRVVVDLASQQDYELVNASNRLIVKLHPAAAAQAPVNSAPAAAETAQAEPSSASTSTETIAAANQPTAETTPAPTPAATETKAPAESAALPSGSTPATTESAAKDFVMVQPTYQTAPAKVDPPARAVEAAARFAPKTDSSLVTPTQPSASLQHQPAVNLAMQQQAAAAAASPVSKPKYNGEPISVNLKDVDLKDFFRLIHEISGLNVVLDPNVQGRLTIVLDDVPWDQALDIVLKNNGLDRQLEGNVLRIATVATLRAEAVARKEQLDAQALAVDKVTVTRFLSYAHSKDVVPTIKKFLSQRGDVVSDDRTNALIIDDIPDSIPRIDALLSKLDRKTQEVEIEARVVAATRNFSRDIGTQLAFGWGNSPTAVGGNADVGATNTNVNFGGGAAGGSSGVPYITVNNTKIPLFSNMPAVGPTSGLTFVNATRNYRLDFQLTMLEQRGLLKILSRPRVVTQNNIQALVRQGVRVPVVTQAQLGGPPTTTYVDAFLRLTVTPQITVENTIFLNVDVENTTPDFSRQVLGNPTLITQQATTQVLVTDGGTVVIGGVIQTQNSVTVQQVPLLGSIPGLGYLFKRRAVSTSTQELIFFITPKILQT